MTAAYCRELRQNGDWILVDPDLRGTWMGWKLTDTHKDKLNGDLLAFLRG
jgi:hypothetical protein